MSVKTLAEKLGGVGNGLEILTCKKCGAHTAAKPPVKCWNCEQKTKTKEAPK